ncbi:MAG: amidophosphoribosyltransferase [Candidatus Doudnabacteria bacterium]|nr:amidophosphoribosyltransferase [Candidatus Doudnabacteria bacterium]
MDNLSHKCGVFGIYGKDLDVSRLAFYGLFALQHRGQESSGIATADGNRIDCYKNMGLVTHVYNEETIQNLKGHIAIGHNRYSTSEGSHIKHAQPVVVNDQLALAHNGNLPSIKKLKEFLEGKDISTDDCSDSELMAKTLGYYLEHGLSIKEAVMKSYPMFTGAFCLTILTKDSLVAVRDTYGIRPLCMGKINGDATVFASESCAFHTVGAEFIREVNPGEMIIVTKDGVESVQIEPSKTKVDIFEFVYFARPDSNILGKSIYEVRRNCGMQLAKEYPVQADIVVPVPETAYPVATGYSKASGIPMEMALVKNRYIHRTFIQPEQHSRDLGVKLKLTPLTEVLKGKKIVVMDDSIVRGTTSRQLVKMLFEAGCAEVHMLVSSPPVKYPDFYGIDTPKQEKLIAAHKTVEEIRQYLGATSLYFLSLPGLIASTGLSEDLFCTSCFTGVYPLDIGERKGDVKEPEYHQVKTEGTLF